MQNEQAPAKGGAGSFIKRVFLKNLGIKIAAVFFSMVLWGVVLTTQNPLRVKTIPNVPASIRYEADLLARNLVVRGDPMAQYDGVEFRVSTPIISYRDLSEDYLSAHIDLTDVRAVGTYQLRIIPNVSMSDSSVVSTNPDHIEVVIDKLVKDREIPVEVRYFGILPNGYWKDAPVIRQRGQVIKSVYISGPEKDILRISKAVCDIQLYNLTNDFNSAINLLLEDEDGNEVDASLFTGELSVTVTMDVLPKKTVPVDVLGSIPDVDQLPANYAVTSYEANPATIDVVGEADRLKDIDRVLLVQFGIAQNRESIMNEKKDINKVPGVRYFNGDTELNEVDVSVFVNEKMREKVLEDIPLVVEGLPRGLKAEVLPATLDIAVKGRFSVINTLDRNDVRAYVDVSGREEGTFENQEIVVYFGSDELTNDLLPGMTLSVQGATVVLSKK